MVELALILLRGGIPDGSSWFAGDEWSQLVFNRLPNRIDQDDGIILDDSRLENEALLLDDLFVPVFLHNEIMKMLAFASFEVS